MFYLQTRRLLQQTEFLMAREKKKRMMPRHLLTAAVMIGVIPKEKVGPEGVIADEELKRIEEEMSPVRVRPTAPA